MTIDFVIDALVTVIGVTTPILLAATGELVVEKSGVLNLGVEGMMLIGAVTGFAVTLNGGDMFGDWAPWVGVAGAVAQCPAPKPDRTDMVNAALTAAQFHRKLGDTLHEVVAPEFDPRR